VEIKLALSEAAEGITSKTLRTVSDILTPLQVKTYLMAELHFMRPITLLEFVRTTKRGTLNR